MYSIRIPLFVDCTIAIQHEIIGNINTMKKVLNNSSNEYVILCQAILAIFIRINHHNVSVIN